MSTNTNAVSSLVFCDGFDYYNEILTKWSGTIGGSSFQVPGRFGYGQCYQIGGNEGSYTFKAFPDAPYARLVFGLATKLEVSSLTVFGPNVFFPIMGFIDSQGNGISILECDTLGRLSFAGVSTGPNVFKPEAWIYIEFDIIFNNSGAGSFMINVNGQTVLQGSNVTTSTVNQGYGIYIMNSDNSEGHSYDDIYVLAPSSSTVGDSFLGDIKIVPLIPNGNGHISQFTQTGGTSGQLWTSVDETPPDGDTSYVSSNTVGQKQEFTLPAPSTVTPVSAIYGVACYALARKDDSPSRFLSVGVGNGSTDNYDAGTALGSTYDYVQRVLPVNPITGLPWTLTDFNTLQIGVKLIS